VHTLRFCCTPRARKEQDSLRTRKKERKEPFPRLPKTFLVGVPPFDATCPCVPRASADPPRLLSSILHVLLRLPSGSAWYGFA
jgi:hypothetical protein